MKSSMSLQDSWCLAAFMRMHKRVWGWGHGGFSIPSRLCILTECCSAAYLTVSAMAAVDFKPYRVKISAVLVKKCPRLPLCR